MACMHSRQHAQYLQMDSPGSSVNRGYHSSHFRVVFAKKFASCANENERGENDKNMKAAPEYSSRYLFSL